MNKYNDNTNISNLTVAELKEILGTEILDINWTKRKLRHKLIQSYEKQINREIKKKNILHPINDDVKRRES